MENIRNTMGPSNKSVANFIENYGQLIHVYVERRFVVSKTSYPWFDSELRLQHTDT